MKRLLHLLVRGWDETTARIQVAARLGHPRWRRLAMALMATLCALTLNAAANGSAAASPSVEDRVKSAYLFNFMKFVDWPDTAFANANTPFTIAVLATGPSIPTARVVAESLKGKVAGPRAIVVRIFDQVGPELQNCHLVFVTSAARQQLSAVRDAVGSRPVLLVGESDGFAQQGGMINLAVTGDTIRCEINLRRAEQANLKLSGRLASVARLVRDEIAP